MADQDTAAITAVLQAQVEGWNRGDAEGYAASSEADLGFTNIMGRRFVGREDYVKIHARIFGGIYAGSRLELEVERITFPGSEVAVAEVLLRLHGATQMPPGISADPDGVLRTRLLEVFERRAGTWCLVACHNTAVIG